MGANNSKRAPKRTQGASANASTKIAQSRMDHQQRREAEHEGVDEDHAALLEVDAAQVQVPAAS
jgi:hypothetical protein